MIFVIITIFLFNINLNGQFRNRPEPKRPDIEFLGWDYYKIGYALGPGENLELLFRNNSDQSRHFPVKWDLKTYVGKSLTSGQSFLTLKPGETGRILVTVPNGLEDGPYKIFYTLDTEGWSGTHPFYFDYRNPVKNDMLNLDLVSFLENMDTEGWVRMMTGPLAKFIDIKNEFPDDQQSVDAAIVIAEALDYYNPKFIQLQDYVRRGGTIIVFGKTAPVLFEMLPVEGSSEKPEKNNPMWLSPEGEIPWYDFHPDTTYLHYPIHITAKKGSQILAKWSDGSPAIVSGKFGNGKVIYVSTGSFQVWQDNPSLLGADELVLRLLYNEKGGESAVKEMLDYASNQYKANRNEEIAIRDRVFQEHKEIEKPKRFMVISKDNMGRFGWLTSEGGLTENIEGLCRITPVRTQDTYQPIPYHVFDFSFAIGNEINPEHVDVQQNWFAKTIQWQYPNGEKLTSTMSLGTPGILWEGQSKEFSITGSDFTNVAYPVKGGIKVLNPGEKVDIDRWSENWLLTFMAKDSIRDMPQLIVFTKRPREVEFNQGLDFTFEQNGFETLFTSRLYGIKRLAPGNTKSWVNGIPDDAVKDARRWSRSFISFPVNCDEIAWIDKNKVKFADKFYFRDFKTDWKTKPLTYTVIPPIYILAKNVGSPVQLPLGLTDLNCPTKYGPLKAIEGTFSVVSVDLPQMEHRAIVPTDEKMPLEDMINRNVAGIKPNSLTYNDQLYDHSAGEFLEDLYPYKISREVPYTEAPEIDMYKWWLVFNAILTRPVYNDSIRNVIDKHFTTRYWETLNYYPHKSLLIRKREPWTGLEYMTTFVWPTKTDYGWRYIGDVQESSAVDAYCYTNYARYYGDWTTLRANWNLCRNLHDFLTETMDWACLSTGAGEYWNATGIDMANSEPFGRLAFAYASEMAGYPGDALRGKIGGTRTLITAVSRLGMWPYIESISSEGDPWLKFKSANFINEFGLQLSRNHRGSVGWLDSSKGAMHELALAYKMWASQAMNEEQKKISESSGFSSLCDLTQQMILGWNRDSLLSKVIDNPRNNQENPTHFRSASDLYDMAILCLGDIPVFLSEWSPAEYISGSYNKEKKEMSLAFRSWLGEDFKVRIYSRYKPNQVFVNNKLIGRDYTYDEKTGWLEINCKGENKKDIMIQFGNPVAPLHPYYTKIEGL